MRRAAADVDADVIVVGSGVAGLAAAVEAAGLGRTVVVVEASSSVGGASAISGGGCCIVGTPVQRALGISDSVELALADWSACSGGEADLVWAERYLRDSRAAIWSWCEHLGLGWLPMARQYPGNSVPRWHRPVGGGSAVIHALVDALAAVPVGWRLDSPVTGIELDDDRVTLTTAGVDGAVDHVCARAVVFATGGFVNDGSMVRDALPNGRAPRHFLKGGHESARGTGHRVLGDLGAAFTHLHNVWFYPVGVRSPRSSDGRGLVVRGITHDIWVNADGERFHDESLRDGRIASAALAQQPGQTCWGVMDAEEVGSTLLLDDGYYGTTERTHPDRLAEFLDRCPDVFSAPTIAELAAELGLPADALQRSVDGYNVRCGEAVDDPLTGRPMKESNPIRSAPFYAYRYQLIAQKTFGGVRTDAECRVVSASGDAMEGVYASGELAGMAGGHINGTGALEGTMFGPAIYSGQIAGRAAAELAASRRQAARMSTSIAGGA